MNPWLPVSPCPAACATATATASAVGPVQRWRRGAALVRSLSGAHLRLMTRPSSSRQRQVVVGTARILTALGVRVEVTAPSTAWPRPGAGRLVVANHVSWVDELALLSAVPGMPVAKSEIASWPLLGAAARRIGTVFVDRARLSDLPAAVASAEKRLRFGGTVLVHPEGTTTCGAELGRFRPAFFQAAVDAGVPVCPVAIRYRHVGKATTLAAYVGDEPLWRSVVRVLAARDLVVEIHQLPPLQAAGADRRELAALAEYAVAGITEARLPVTAAHPAPSRPGTGRPPAVGFRDPREPVTGTPAPRPRRSQPFASAAAPVTGASVPRQRPGSRSMARRAGQH